MIVVTGGAGFIGSNIAAALIERGREVAVCDRLGSGEKWRNLAKHAIADLIPPESWREGFARHEGRIEAVVHMAAVTSTSERDADLMYGTNVRFARAMWDWCTQRGRRLIYASSAATYGDGSQGFDDDPDGLSRLRPLNLYGWSKHLFDRQALQLSVKGAAPPHWAGLKFFNVYGPNEYHKAEMSSVAVQNFQRARAGKPVRLFRSHRPDYIDGGQVRDFVHVRDCVAVVLWLLEHPEAGGRVYNLGTGQARSWLDLAGALFAAVGKRLTVEFIDMPDSLRPNYQYRTEARMDRLRAAGYSAPFTTLEAGIADYVQNYLATGDPYR